MSAFVWTFVAVVLTAFVADFFYRRFASGRIRKIIEDVPTFAAIPTPPSPDVEVIRIPTEDNSFLEGCLHLPETDPAGLVLFCPELNGNHWTALHYGRALIDAGFAVLAFDFRNQGGSDCREDYAPIHWVTEFELSDIRAVLDFAETEPKTKDLPIGIFGVSRGGSAALTAACRFPEIRAVVTDSGYGTMALIRHFMNKFSRFVVPDWFFSRLPDWHIDIVLRQALKRSERLRNCRYVHLDREARDSARVPHLLISGRRDSYVAPAVTENIADILGCSDSVWIVEKAKHNKSRDRSPEEYDRRLVDHFRQHLPSDDSKAAEPDDRSHVPTPQQTT